MWSLIRCDASADIGFGHVFRGLALARELTERGLDVSFAVADAPEGAALIARAGYRVLGIRTGLDALPVADALILDVRDASPRAWVDMQRARGAVVATIDDPTDRRLSADLAFYPPIPQVDELDWRGFSGTRLVGGEWVVLRRQFAEPPMRTRHDPPRVLVTMGGSDPAGMTITAVNAIAAMSEPFDLSVVIGPGYRDRHLIEPRLAQLRRRVTVVEQPADMRAVMVEADLAVASFGVTAYELAATATPAVYLCLTSDHARSATLLASRQAAIVLGVHTGAEAPSIGDAVARLLANGERRDAMGRAGRALIDGRGAARVADRIVREIEVRSTTGTR